MRTDALAFEPHFLDHLAPVWDRLPDDARGRFTVDRALASRAERLGIDADVIDAGLVRAAWRHPAPNPGEGPVALVASYGDIKVGRRMGYRRFAFLEHGAGQSYAGDRRHGAHGSYAGGVDREDVGLFLVPNRAAGARWASAYPDATVAVVGCPKLDALPSREPGPGPVVAIGMHWDCHLVPETRTAWGHYRESLPALARRFRLIGHGHPRAVPWLERGFRRAGIEWVADFDEVCRRADLYVADNSSTLFEFAATGRPVVVLNAPWYRRHVRHGLRFWDAAGVGVNVDGPDELPDAIEAALADGPELAFGREAALELVYARRTGAAADAAVVVAAWLRVPQLVGAA